ncbi:hypothetical protein [Pseudophaeobacter arcticus]|jgi:hypothetical protein|uniref:hypothetical protein n=1 Tax=Pseudophaeobacter arcticus TaxID=385492 RepID=UPI0004033D96|nr:hypothetical protein [Pseudophaeobacter arcticus]
MFVKKLAGAAHVLIQGSGHAPYSVWNFPSIVAAGRHITAAANFGYRSDFMN